MPEIPKPVSSPRLKSLDNSRLFDIDRNEPATAERLEEIFTGSELMKLSVQNFFETLEDDPTDALIKLDALIAEIRSQMTPEELQKYTDLLSASVIGLMSSDKKTKLSVSKHINQAYSEPRLRSLMMTNASLDCQREQASIISQGEYINPEHPQYIGAVTKDLFLESLDPEEGKLIEGGQVIKVEVDGGIWDDCELESDYLVQAGTLYQFFRADLSEVDERVAQSAASWKSYISTLGPDFSPKSRQPEAFSKLTADIVNSYLMKNYQALEGQVNVLDSEYLRIRLIDSMTGDIMEDAADVNARIKHQTFETPATFLSLTLNWPAVNAKLEIINRKFDNLIVYLTTRDQVAEAQKIAVAKEHFETFLADRLTELTTLMKLAEELGADAEDRLLAALVITKPHDYSLLLDIFYKAYGQDYVDQTLARIN